MGQERYVQGVQLEAASTAKPEPRDLVSSARFLGGPPYRNQAQNAKIWGPVDICFSDPERKKVKASLATWHILPQNLSLSASLINPLQAQPFHLLYSSCRVTIDHISSDLSCSTRSQYPRLPLCPFAPCSSASISPFRPPS